MLRLLAPRPGETVVDCTAGQGGHAAALGTLAGPTGTVVINDLDEGCLAVAKARLEATPGCGRVVAVRGNFADLPRTLAGMGLAADVVLADLGFSSSQMDNPSRGFSFRAEGPLDMRLDPSRGASAAELVNTLPEVELVGIIREFGEERMARAIARKLVDARERSPIQTTSRLAELIRSVVGVGGSGRIDPATRTFQALRIAVNDELGNLSSLLESVERGAMVRRRPSAAVGGPEPSGRAVGGGWLAAGARVGVISFHSLEDRLVKQAFQRMAESGLGEALTRRPVEADEREIDLNRRSRSARLRVLRLL